MMLGAYARHAVLESLHAGSGKECGELRCSAAKPALLDPLCDVLVISMQQDTLEDWRSTFGAYVVCVFVNFDRMSSFQYLTRYVRGVGEYLRRICCLPVS